MRTRRCTVDMVGTGGRRNAGATSDSDETSVDAHRVRSHDCSPPASSRSRSSSSACGVRVGVWAGSGSVHTHGGMLTQHGMRLALERVGDGQAASGLLERACAVGARPQAALNPRGSNPEGKLTAASRVQPRGHAHEAAQSSEPCSADPTRLAGHPPTAASTARCERKGGESHVAVDGALRIARGLPRQSKVTSRLG